MGPDPSPRTPLISRGGSLRRWQEGKLRPAEVAVVNLVSNAFYDVTRYPGHVARMTNPKGGTLIHRRLYLGRALRSKSFTSFEWKLRAMSAFFFTCLTPMCVMLAKGSDSSCSGGDNEPQTASFLCNLEVRTGTVVAESVSVGLAAPIIYALLTLVMSFSLSFTRKVYSAYVKFTLWWFFSLRSYLHPILMNYIHKPTSSAMVDGVLGTLQNIWTRLWFMPYVICIWLFSIEISFAIMSVYLGEPSWGGILMLFAWQMYFPAMNTLLQPESTLRSLLTSELQRRPLHENSNETTDLWLRLFNASTSCFCCTREELNLIIQYFEDSHLGYTTEDGQLSYKWPIWWHDELCLTGNGMIKQIYIEDLDIAIPREMPHGTVDYEIEEVFDVEETMAFEVESFLTSCNQRIEAMRNSREDA